jgi:hypothetical protein
LPDPISVNKLQSEGFWDITKEILGWIFNGETHLVSPQHTHTHCHFKHILIIKGSLQFVATKDKSWRKLAEGKTLVFYLEKTKVEKDRIKAAPTFSTFSFFARCLAVDHYCLL